MMRATAGHSHYQPRLTSVVLPAYNAAAVVAGSLRELATTLDDGAGPWEAVVVCDGCSDATAEVAREFAEHEPRVRVVEYRKNRGKGHAVRTGLMAARGQYRLFTDIDLAYGESLLTVVQRLRLGAEVAIASRAHPDTRLVVSPALVGYCERRGWQSAVFSRAVRAILPIPYVDTQAGLKGMTARVAERIVPNLTCDGFALDCELLIACQRLGIAVAEVGVRLHIDSRASTVGAKHTLKMLADLWAIRRRWPAGRTLHEPYSLREAV